MTKVFLYLFPIKEYTEMFLLSEDSLYDEWNIKRPLPILEECIQKRYRDNGYQVVFAIYPDRDIYGITPHNEDRILTTDITFSESSAIDENKNIKENFIPKYANEILLISQLGDIDRLVVGGYHAQDCVRRFAEAALDMGIDTLVDLDLTDLFFGLYKNERYFKIDEYDPIRYKEHIFEEENIIGPDIIKRLLKASYSSPVYGLRLDDEPTKKI